MWANFQTENYTARFQSWIKLWNIPCLNRGCLRYNLSRENHWYRSQNHQVYSDNAGPETHCRWNLEKREGKEGILLIGLRRVIVLHAKGNECTENNNDSNLFPLLPAYPRHLDTLRWGVWYFEWSSPIIVQSSKMIWILAVQLNFGSLYCGGGSI